jgi:translation initiation factor IF-1
MYWRGGRTMQVDGVVREVFAAAFFRVEIDDGFTVTCRPNAKLRLNRVSICVGDKVVVELPTDSAEISKGRITWRYQGT